MLERLKVADEIKDINFISILSDGSIDSSTTEQELFYLWYIVNGTPVVRFVASIHVERGDSISIFKAMQKGVGYLDIPWTLASSKLVGLRCEGASVMNHSQKVQSKIFLGAYSTPCGIWLASRSTPFSGPVTFES